nr:MAG TPA: YjcQ protein [Bacteriophage sp.]
MRTPKLYYISMSSLTLRSGLCLKRCLTLHLRQRRGKRMVELEQEEALLKALCQFYEHTDPNVWIYKDFVSNVVGKQNADAVLDVLCADGYAKVEGFNPLIRICENNSPTIRLTDKGKTYFVEKQRKQRITRRQAIQSIVLSLISAVIGGFISRLFA